MVEIERIQKEIRSLSSKDFYKLRNWIIEKDWDYWDRKIENDTLKGKLDFLVEEALKEKYNNKLKNL